MKNWVCHAAVKMSAQANGHCANQGTTDKIVFISADTDIHR